MFWLDYDRDGCIDKIVCSKLASLNLSSNTTQAERFSWAGGNRQQLLVDLHGAGKPNAIVRSLSKSGMVVKDKIVRSKLASLNLSSNTTQAESTQLNVPPLAPLYCLVVVSRVG